MIWTLAYRSELLLAKARSPGQLVNLREALLQQAGGEAPYFLIGRHASFWLISLTFGIVTFHRIGAPR